MTTRPSRPDASNSSPTTSLGNDHSEQSRSHLSQRRDKPQLSCKLCKQRKVRCDRQNPCGTCIRRGLARSCVYSSEVQESIIPRSTGTVHERLHHLESLVISLMQQQDANTTTSLMTSELSVTNTPSGFVQNDITLYHDEEGFEGSELQPSAVASFSDTIPAESFIPSIGVEANGNTPPVSVECGSINLDSSGTAKYVGSAHWAAVLDSIAELKGHLEQKEEIRRIANNVDTPNSVHSSWPQLLYSGPPVAAAEILSSIPPRQEVDRLIARYFTLEIAPGVLHSGQFLREYEHFWEEPSAIPIVWVGLLFTIMCLGALHPSQTASPKLDLQPSLRVDIFRKRVVQCLKLGNYTKGGPFVLVTLIQYYMIEHFLCQDTEFDIWILHCILIPMSFRMGLHRDPKHFKGISIFEGEMRRRIWATIFQIDACLSSMTGLPRIIKPDQCDTEEPRNVLDSDFDEGTTEPCQSRPDSETTPILYLLAKSRIISVGGIISDLSHEIRPYPYDARMRVEKLLQAARDSLPSSLQWQPFAQSITQTSQTIMQRMYLNIFFHKMRITLYKKYLEASMTQPQYRHPREVCLDSAMKILEYQHVLDEETQPDGRLSSVSWAYISIINHDFLLAASVLCFYIKLLNENQVDVNDLETSQQILSLLRKSHDIWLRSSATSKEAQKAVQSLNPILGIKDDGEQEEIGHNFFDDSAYVLAQFDNPLIWPAHQDSLASYNQPSSGFETMIDEYHGILNSPYLRHTEGD